MLISLPMDGHPIPQDITGFQFKLIGEMTVKQFAYVAAAAVLAWVIYSLPIFTIIKIPIVAIVALAGAGFAFVPAGGRPMDIMAINFLKALFSSSKYIYQKSSPPAPASSPAPSAQTQPVTFAPVQQSAPAARHPIETPVDTSHSVPFIVTEQVINPTPTPTPALAATPVASEPEKVEKDLEQKETVLETQIQEVKQEEAQATNTPSFEQIHQKVLDLERLLAQTTAQRQELERQVIELHQRLSSQTQKTYSPSQAQPPKETKNVRSIPSNMKKSTGVPIAPEYPNLLIGIVKDPRGNPLPNILVEVKDKDGNPVRALKTNGLGQFSAATPLTNGTYDISFEDSKGQGKFDTVEINATGAIIQPLEIISQDAREELRKALFN